MFYVYLYHFGVITFAFYPETVVRMCSLKSFFKSFAKFTRKHVCPSLFLSAASNSLKQRLRDRCLPVKFCKFLKPLLLTDHLRLLLLSVTRYQI